MAEHQDQRRAEHRDAVLDRAERARVDRVAGDAYDEQLAQAAAEQMLGRRARIRAADDHGERRLALGQLGDARRTAGRHAGAALDERGIAFLEPSQRLVGCELGLGARRGAYRRCDKARGQRGATAGEVWNKVRRESWADIGSLRIMNGYGSGKGTIAVIGSYKTALSEAPRGRRTSRLTKHTG